MIDGIPNNTNINNPKIKAQSGLSNIF